MERFLACGVAGLSVLADSLSAIKYAKVKPVRDKMCIRDRYSNRAIGPKSRRLTDKRNTMSMVSRAYKLYGIVLMNIAIPSSTPLPAIVPATVAAQLEIGAIIQIGAAVESIR